MNEEVEVSAMLESVTRSLRGLTELVTAVWDAIKEQDGKTRELQAKVYAQEQELAELRREVESLTNRHNALAQSYNWHEHDSNGYA